MKITVVGTGYVGLVSGACLAEMGNDVLCLDLDVEKIRILGKGLVPFYEPGLQEMVSRNVSAGRLNFTASVEESVRHGIIQFIAVGTPSEEDGLADIKHVLAAARSIGRLMSDYKVVVDKSTVPVGTADLVKMAISDEMEKRGVYVPFSVVSNPEFLKEGAAVEDFMRPDRIVLGSDDERALALMRALYAPFQRNHDRLIVTDAKSAELIKYASNAMLATRISFMNEMANLAEILGVDIEMVRRGIGLDPRIGRDFLYPGCGYGGSCFPKDIKALIKTALDKTGVALKVLAAVEEVNDAQKHVLGRKVINRFGGNLHGRRFAVWGLAFKPNTDDMRNAPSRALLADLFSAGATVTAYDPVAMNEARRIFGDEPALTYAEKALDALNDADALIIITEWKEFRSADLGAIAGRLKNPLIFDGRNLYDPAFVRSQGIEYFPIGR